MHIVSYLLLHFCPYYHLDVHPVVVLSSKSSDNPALSVHRQCTWVDTEAVCITHEVVTHVVQGDWWTSEARADVVKLICSPGQRLIRPFLHCSIRIAEVVVLVIRLQPERKDILKEKLLKSITRTGIQGQ